MTSSTDFVLWNVYLDEVKDDPLFYYLAQIALEIRRTRVKNPNRVKLNDFLLDFNKRRKNRGLDFSKMSKEDAVKQSKAAFFAMMGTTAKKVGHGHSSLR